MEFYNSLPDPLMIAVIGVCVLVCAILIKELFTYLRDIIPSSVKCWFCHFETQVHYKSSNSWICPKCDQYNGFSKDGGYNRDIPSQYDSKLNTPTFTQLTSSSNWSIKNKLCYKCNLKQELKTQQLASFVPMNEKNYDKEIEHFQKQIEKNFELCQDCNVLLAKVLQNLREELSLPKRLTAAVLKINFRGERAIYINLILSLLLGLSSFKFEFSSLPYDIQNILKEERFLKNVHVIMSHPWAAIVIENIVQILIGTGICINSIGFCQTNSAAMFLNIVSWFLMFFLTLYPDGFDDLISILKIASSFVSVTISVILLLNNQERKCKKKTSLWEKKNTCKSLSNMTASTSNMKQASPHHSNISLNKSNNKSSAVNNDDSPGSISSGISNLSIGIKQRREIKRSNPRPIVTPPKFNPFNKIPSEKGYQVYGKAGSSAFSHYEPSLTPPSMYEGYDPAEPIATIPSFSYQQPCYPCSPTLAYYFTAQQYPKIMSLPDRYISPTSKSCEREMNYFWIFLQSVPSIILVISNLVMAYLFYFKHNTIRT